MIMQRVTILIAVMMLVMSASCSILDVRNTSVMTEWCDLEEPVTYYYNVSNSEMQSVVEIFSIQREDSIIIYEMYIDYAETPTWWAFRNKSGKLTQHSSLTYDDTTATYTILLDTPVKEGNYWSDSWSIASVGKSITVEAGTFDDCVLILHYEGYDSSEFWYSPELGMFIKKTYNYYSPERTVIYELANIEQ